MVAKHLEGTLNRPFLHSPVCLVGIGVYTFFGDDVANNENHSEGTMKKIIAVLLSSLCLSLPVLAEDDSHMDKAKEATGEAWENTKKASSEVWDATKEGSKKTVDATKEGGEKAWDATKEGSEKAWDATKEGSKKAWDATKEGSKKAVDATKEAVDPE